MVRGAFDCTAASLPSGTRTCASSALASLQVSVSRTRAHSNTWHVTKTKKGVGLRPHPRLRIERVSFASLQLAEVHRACFSDLRELRYPIGGLSQSLTRKM